VYFGATLEKANAYLWRGVMSALRTGATREGWFSGYDWVIRVNPDVIIRASLVTFSLHD